MNKRRKSRPVVAGLLASLLTLVGCTTNGVVGSLPTIPAAQPAMSPAPSQRPAGTVRPLTCRASAAVFDARTGQLAVLCGSADSQATATLAVLDTVGRSRMIALSAPATALTGDGRGMAYLASRGGYFTVDLVTGSIARVDVGDAADIEFTAIAQRGDGAMVLGSSSGAVYTLAADSAIPARVISRVAIFARVDAIVAQGNTTVVVDRGQTSVTTVGPDGKPQYALRAGQGATTLAAAPGGPALIADTRGGQLLVYGTDPLILRQAYPVGDAPYGLAGSGSWAWLTHTATNTVVGYDLASGIPVEKVRYPTVQQPNTLAVDESAGTLYVISAVGSGVQVIDHAAGLQ